MEIRHLEAELRAKSESRTIYGYAAKFETWSEPIWGVFIESIARGAFDGADMSDVVCCYNHNQQMMLARTKSGTLLLKVDDIGLYFEFEAPNTTVGNDCLEMVRRGDISKCSFAFYIKEEAWDYAPDDERANKKYDKRTILSIKELVDVSLVVRPAYEDTEAAVSRYKEERAQKTSKQEIDEKPKRVDTSSRDRTVRVMEMKMKINQNQ